MNRKVLLIEPNYKNKYPPIGLMKIATYFRRCNDDVRFFKGNLKEFAARLLCEEYYAKIKDCRLGKYFSNLIKYILSGRKSSIELIVNFNEIDPMGLIYSYRKRYVNGDIPQFDIVCVTTLFTFYWAQIIDTINAAKKFKKDNGRIMVGGVAATILSKYIVEETGIEPHVGLLDKPGVFDENNPDIIDELPLDYSILDEIDYIYPQKNAYFGYMTRGCIRHCPFCAVPILEPNYKSYIGIKEQLQYVNEHFGAKKDLMLMDNNVFASNQFNEIIDEIKRCGFGKHSKYLPPNEYDIAIEGLKSEYNIRASIRKIIRIYDDIANHLNEKDKNTFYIQRDENGLLYPETAEKDKILKFDTVFKPIYMKHKRPVATERFIDFNQGVDARLATPEKMKKLSEINIRPLRIAFDHYEQKDIYIKAVELAAKNGIKKLSNYLLYNFMDTPEQLYYRMKINVDLCEKLNVDIYSFPMKYHPIADPEYFRNRNYIGKYWNRKFIRAIQAVLNATKGKIGRGQSFFKAAFGANVQEFRDILWMPEAFIIFRNKYKANTEEWKKVFYGLPKQKLEMAKEIIAANDFSNDVLSNIKDSDILNLLQYYIVEHRR